MQVGLYSRPRSKPGAIQKDAPYFGRKFECTRNIPFGVAVMAYASSMQSVMRTLPQVVSLSTALTASNTLAGKVVINGVEKSVTATYSVSHGATLDAFIASITAHDPDGIYFTSVTKNGNEVTINAKEGNEIYFSGISVTGGTAVIVTLELRGKITGASRAIQKEREIDGSVIYKQDNYDIVEVAEKGSITLLCEDTGIDPTIDQVYVRIIPETDKVVGALKKSADSGKAVLWENASFLNSEDSSGVDILIS